MAQQLTRKVSATVWLLINSHMKHMIYTVRLAIRVSTSVNNTELLCEVILNGNIYPQVNSSHAKLLVIAGEVNDR